MSTADHRTMSEIVRREEFLKCRTLREVADLTARFCASTHPDTTSWTHLAPLAEESESIRSDLISLNRRGWVTVGSQPSEVHPKHHCFQRAAVHLMVPRGDYGQLLAELKGKTYFNYSTTLGDSRYDGRADTWVEGKGLEYQPLTRYVQVPYPVSDPRECAPGLTDVEAANTVLVAISDVSPNFPRRLWNFLDRAAPPLPGGVNA